MNNKRKMKKKKKKILVGCLWLTPVILATQEEEIRRIAVQNQSRQIDYKTLSRKYPTQKRAGGVVQVIRGPA
jgi:hypothetical protein